MSFHSSQFTGSGGRDLRRRRLLAEERADVKVAAGAAARRSETRSGPTPVHKSPHYGDAEFLKEPRRLLDLIPRRLASLALLLMLGLTTILGLEALYVWTSDLLAAAPGARLPAFGLTGPGTLAAWFSALLLLAATALALLVYAIRRHRTDDYHGRYRVWLWAALCLFLLATGVATSLCQTFQELMITVTGTRLMDDGAVWWFVPAAFLLGGVGSRLLVDMWPARLSSAALVSTAVCYATSGAMQLGWLPTAGGADRIMLQQGAGMVGHLLLLLAMGLHARYVLRDAEGLLPHDETRSAGPNIRLAKIDEEAQDAAEPEDTSTEDEWAPADSSRSAPPVLQQGSAAMPALGASATPVRAAMPLRAVAPARPATMPSAPASAFPAAASSAAVRPLEPSADHKLNKAERKDLKKRMLQERLQREQAKAASWGK
jgi:hypothetical protein